jgi:hypothetical protein
MVGIVGNLDENYMKNTKTGDATVESTSDIRSFRSTHSKFLKL